MLKKSLRSMPEAFLYRQVEQEQVEHRIPDLPEQECREKQGRQADAATGEPARIVEDPDRRSSVQTAVREQVEQPHAQMQERRSGAGYSGAEQIHRRPRQADTQQIPAGEDGGAGSHPEPCSAEADLAQSGTGEAHGDAVTAFVQETHKQDPEEKLSVSGEQNERKHRRKSEIDGDLQTAEGYFHKLPASPASCAVHGRSGALLCSRKVSVTAVYAP